jgi:Fe-S-cluster containining protein
MNSKKEQQEQKWLRAWLKRKARRHELPVLSEEVTAAECKGCGACCFNLGHPIYDQGSQTDPPDEYWLKLPLRLKAEILNHLVKLEDEFKLGKRGLPDDCGERCIWLQADGTCKHYEHRPEVCRDYEPGPDCLPERELLIQQARDWGIIADLPGDA